MLAKTTKIIATQKIFLWNIKTKIIMSKKEINNIISIM
jgi:hypothetical protein